VVESAAAGHGGEAPLRGAPEVDARGAYDGMATHTLATEAGRQADLDFHTALLTATNNPFIISLTNGVSAAIRTTTIFKQRKRPLRRDPIPDHLRVFEAIAARQAEPGAAGDERADRTGAHRHASRETLGRRKPSG
jgi:DNA-binding FadR family transcriptional regulator